ncbi:hypothetical protein SeMB42_g07661 [Synchytrium endobioticum]|nr:hypothetical protein SeMB42_g07661 [Synchytrium endobioticum]
MQDKRLFSEFGRVTALQGLCYEVDDYACVTCWYAPHVEITSHIFTTGIAGKMLQTPLTFLKRLLIDYVPRADSAKAKYLKFIEYDKKLGYYYLLIAGTRKDKQGQGLLKHNMLPVLEEADSKGILCWLESSKESNVPIYERFGFKIVDTFHLKDKVATVPVYCMARLPQPSPPNAM